MTIEKPPADASATEIMEWIEESHTEAMIEALEDFDGDVTATE